MLGKIILEEAWNLPRLAKDAAGYASPVAAIKLEKDMTDIRGRLLEMDEQVKLSISLLIAVCLSLRDQGVEMQVLSLTAPGTQGFYLR